MVQPNNFFSFEIFFPILENTPTRFDPEPKSPDRYAKPKFKKRPLPLKPSLLLNFLLSLKNLSKKREKKQPTKMVSKITKRTPTKSIRDTINHHNRRRNRKRSPNKKAPIASTVVASINKSIYNCHRRLIKLFSKLSKTTPKKRTPRKKGYQILPKLSQDDKNPNLIRSLFTENALPQSILPDKKTIFLDLDETLVHSVPDPPPENYDFIVRPVIDGARVNFYVLKRPFVEKFLDFLGEKFEVVIFTAGIEEYAKLVVDRIDRRNAISHRLYRDSCREIEGKFVKDLSELGRDLKNVVIVDDNPNCYMLQPDNAIPIRPFVDDLEDMELEKLVGFFEGCGEFEDMRDAVKNYVGEGNEKVGI